MSSQIEGTTGSSTQDPVGKRGRKTPVGLLVTLQELEELLDAHIANYHATPHEWAHGRSHGHSDQRHAALPV